MSEFRKVNAKEYVEELKEKGVAELEAAKFARIIARQGIVGEEVTTYVDTGLVETVNSVKSEIDENGNEKPGYIITMANEHDEPIIDKFGHTNTYIIPASTFEKKYEETDMEGIFKPKGGPQLFMQIQDNISIIASWGEEQNLEAGAFMNVTNPNDLYGIAYNEFQQTYAWTDKVSIDEMSKLIDPNNKNEQTIENSLEKQR